MNVVQWKTYEADRYVNCYRNGMLNDSVLNNAVI